MPPAPYHLGLASLDREVRIPDLPIEGAIPPWLKGTLIRNGPARFEIEGERYNHWFDGLAMLHAFVLDGGRVGYANRFLHSSSFREARRSGRIRRSEFGTDPCFSLFGRVMAIFRPPVTDNANINVVELADGPAALTETPLPIRFDAVTLETLGVTNFEDDLGGTVTTAHPHRDPDTGTLYSYLADFSLRSTYHLYRIRPGSRRRERLASLPVDRPAYMHSFAMTERHLILAEFPLVVNPARILLSGEPFIRNYRWEPERGTRLQVFDRDGGGHRGTFVAPPFFAFHHINAFDDPRPGTNGGDEVVVDLAGYDDPSIIEELYLDRLRDGGPSSTPATPVRLRLDPARGSVRREILSEQSLELPRVNEGRVSGRPYRVVWGVGNRVPGHFTDELVRLDVTTGDVRTWYREGCFPGEPVFIERPGSTPGPEGEDDGVLLSVVLDARHGCSFLLVLDAAQMTEVGRAVVPHPMPLGFHGQFFRG